MRLGCDKRCPKVREQLKRAREEAREETDDEDSSSAGPSTGEKAKHGFSERSKPSSSHRSGAASPTKSVGTQRSQHTLARGSPVRSERRSKESRRSKGHPSGRGERGRGADPSRRLDQELGSTRRSHESELTVREQRSAEKKKTAASPKSPRNGRSDRNEYETGSSSGSDAVQRTPDYAARGLKRGAVGKGRKKIPEDGDKERAGPSRKTRGRKEAERDDEASEDRLQKWRSGAHDRCGPHCRARGERVGRSGNEEQRKEADDYLLHKSLPYFEDLCNFCHECRTSQLWKDRFVKSTVASVAVFALGLKLCWDLDGWTIPNPL